LGEWLPALAPSAFELAVAPASLGRASFAMAIPDQPLLLGHSLALQGAFLASSLPGTPVEFSNAPVGLFSR
jgi:hypothetical protein